MNFIYKIKEKIIEKQLREKIILVIVFLFILVTYLLISTPYKSAPTVIHIGYGDNINSISKDLDEKNIIRSTKVFKLFILIFQSGKQIPTGDYYFNREPVWRVALMLSRGDHHIVPIKITFREGLSNQQMANILSSRMPDFNFDEFISKTNTKQGYLFPDTYFFYPMTTTDEVIETMQSNFYKKMDKLSGDFSKSKYTRREIITMASILEGEAKGESDSGMISGILWKRLKGGMLLQVDVDKDTYKNKGLPKRPISNPGLSTIKSALNPVPSNYLFYLHDKTGQVHYSVTYTEHRNNIKKYLK